MTIVLLIVAGIFLAGILALIVVALLLVSRPAAPPSPASPSGLSPDGNWWWDGSHWVPSGRTSIPPTPPASPAP